MPNLTNHFFRTTNRLPGNIGGSVLNFIAAVVLAALSSLRRVTKLSAQAFCTIVQSAPDKFLWSRRDLPFRPLFYRCFFFYLFDAESPRFTIKFQFVANKFTAIIVQYDGSGICSTLLLGK